ncbi:Sterol 3-beta-glucosyltransferase [Stygiomarasmius scandens]|uniref:sterol 3beta-glucosyltransferase n=1 Tax=Marasmiellus scandens TaxID=2682957 RepID=A0ABR1JWU4_9AGAR
MDDSPFINPESPPSRPSLASFRGDGSMRAGTQTLIQALQAIPWSQDPDNDDEILNHAPTDDSDDDDAKPIQPLASSIHTIYRPLARSRRLSLSRFESNVPEEPSSSDLAPSDSEPEDAHDFEDTTPKMPPAPKPASIPPTATATQVSRLGFSMSRTGSMATVRLARRAKLAQKLREVFELQGIDEVHAELPCWLLRSVLLQGYMYLTNTYLCFFAHMPSREDQVLKSGSLNKKAQRTKRWIKHWFVLKNDVLSWYQSSSDPYFPHGIVDLRYAISCDAIGEKDFRLRTNQKTVLLSADSVPSREEWVKAIRKVMFKAQNMGDSVKIAIPYSAILDVDKSSAMDFSETIEVKVYDKEASDHYSVDSFFFAYFHDLPTALDQIRDAVRSQRTQGTSQSRPVLDTTQSRNQLTHGSSATLGSTASSSNGMPERPLSSLSSFRISSLLRPFSSSSSAPNIHETSPNEEFTHIAKRPHSSFVVDTTSSPSTPGDEDGNEELPTPIAHQSHSRIHSNSSTVTPPSLSASADHTYPPSTILVESPQRKSATSPSTTGSGSAGGAAAVGSSGSAYTTWMSVPNWLKPPKSRLLFGNSSSTVNEPVGVAPPGGKVREMYSSTSTSESRPSPTSASSTASKWTGDLAFSVLETPETSIDEDVADKFRAAFAYDEKESLLGYFPGYIFRLLPVFGRLYISTNFFCFKSSGPLASRTRMTLPIKDILSAEKSKATRFGHHGLIVIIKGHEELFFEFGAEDKRDAFVYLLERQIESVRKRLAEGATVVQTQGQRDAMILEEETRSPSIIDEPLPNTVTKSGSALMISNSPPENMTDSLPAVMFTSASSTFLTFKPSKSLHFTMLTIGSRGDVQPYIALAKGLIADGHRVRIATHGEFKEWIESYGIEYGYVGGDPAELMRICVENGTFTVSFLKEGLQKFRGWLDDLLKTSWEACQGTDVLIESPSAMGGYHIAEALSIPYYRAFTMTWTRTRAYPHAFAVPERKMGGSYNYMSYVMFDQVFWRAISGQINRWRRNLLQLGSTSLDKMEPHKIPFLYNFSPHVVPPPLDWPEWIRVTGYWFLDSADVSSKKWTPPSDLVNFIDSAHQQGKKVVYIGFGSIVVSDPRSMTRCVIEAVVRSGVYAILSKGWSDRLQVKAGEASEPEEPIPKQIYPISSIPHDWLFERIDAVCHHGGAGTTGASLRAGRPTIIKPFFGDQFFWADRVEALGVGTGVRKLTVESLTEALINATTDRKQIDRARLVGEQIRAEDGVATAIESIYRDLEYAKSLIKRSVPDTSDDEDEHEDSTIRRHRRRKSSDPQSGYSSSGSAWGAPSEDWSVISEQDDRRSSISSRRSRSGGRSRSRQSSEDQTSRRTSIAAAMLSVLPDSLVPGSPRKRTISST